MVSLISLSLCKLTARQISVTDHMQTFRDLIYKMLGNGAVAMAHNIVRKDDLQVNIWRRSGKSLFLHHDTSLCDRCVQ